MKGGGGGVRFRVRMRPTSTWTAPPWKMLRLSVDYLGLSDWQVQRLSSANSSAMICSANKMNKWLHILVDLRSQSEFTTQQNCSQRKTRRTR